MADRNWVFQQLTGDRKKLELAGWSAPFGRPRQQPVVRDAISVRHRSTRYPGSKAPPTRHLFGINYQDLSLNGRFRDRELGSGGALAKKEEVKSFIKDQQTCDISWGSIIHITGLISEFDPGIESPAEIEWKMKILVDQDNIEVKQVGENLWSNPSSQALELALRLELLEHINIHPAAGGIKVSVLDQLDDAISSVTGTLGQLTNIANTISNFESGLANEAKRLIASIHSVKTAVLTLIDTMESARQDVFFVRDSAKDTINWDALMRDSITEANIAMALLSNLENQASASLRGRAQFTIRAKQGDTWESISTRIYGSPSQADAIRQANGAKFGQKPRAGEQIVLPGI